MGLQPVTDRVALSLRDQIYSLEVLVVQALLLNESVVIAIRNAFAHL